jgi:hypothetical protein
MSRVFGQSSIALPSDSADGARCIIEPLERRNLLSAPASAPLTSPSNDPYLFAAHAKVEGRTLEQWSAKWWQNVLGSPIYAADGTTYVNPSFVDGTAARVGSGGHGDVGFLYGSVFGGTVTRGSATQPLTVKPETLLYVPLENFEFSNPDTPSKASGYTAVPGDFTASELAKFTNIEAGAVTHLNLTIDGHSVAESTLFEHRETAPIFSYDLPAKFNLDQVFFNENISGHVTPAAADGFYAMLKPLSPGRHTISFGGAYSDLSATPPLLSGGSGEMTYYLNVLPEKQGHGDNAGEENGNFVPPTTKSSGSGDSAKKNDSDILDRFQNVLR